MSAVLHCHRYFLDYTWSAATWSRYLQWNTVFLTQLLQRYCKGSFLKVSTIKEDTGVFDAPLFPLKYSHTITRLGRITSATSQLHIVFNFAQLWCKCSACKQGLHPEFLMCGSTSYPRGYKGEPPAHTCLWAWSHLQRRCVGRAKCKMEVSVLVFISSDCSTAQVGCGQALPKVDLTQS